MRSLLAVGVLSMSLTGCGTPAPAAVTAERAVLERELANLDEYLDIDFGRLLVEGDLLIILRQELLAEVLQALMPVERVVGEGAYRVRLDEAIVDLRTGLALIELRGRASLVERPSVYADMAMFAVLDGVGIAGDPPVLEARPEVLAIEAREVGVGGLSPPAERLINELAWRRLAELGALVTTLSLPVSLERSLRLPSVAEAGVTIPELSLGMAMSVERVLVADRRMWIEVRVDPRPDTASVPGLP